MKRVTVVCLLVAVISAFPSLSDSVQSHGDASEESEVLLAQTSQEVLHVAIDQTKCPNLCSGRGKCVINTDKYAPPQNTTVCICDQGWTNYDCSTIIGSASWRKDGVDCPNHCSSHGVCYRGSSVVSPRCYCDPKWTGADCSHLRETFLLCPNNCSGSGVCTLGFSVALDSVVGKCMCDVFHSGDDCSVEKIVKCPNECSGHGKCSANGCVCDEGKYGTDCSLSVVPLCPGNCSSHGRCANGQCFCYSGFSGADCSEAYSFSCPSNCSGHGVCVDATLYFPAACRCHKDWTGQACDRKRPPKQDCPRNCSGNGRCLPNLLCECDAGYEGVDCSARATLTAAALSSELERVNGSVVHPLYMEPSKAVPREMSPGVLDVIPLPVCLNNCSSHGVCVEVVAAPNASSPSSLLHYFVCKCDPGYGGGDCSAEAAANTGLISAADALMTPKVAPASDGKSTGMFATDPVSWDDLPTMGELRALAMGCLNNCSSRGRCLRNTDGTKACSCYMGWSGADCSTKVGSAQDCPLDCSPHGHCVTASEYFPIHCMCAPGWYGERCEQPRPAKLVFEMQEGLCPNHCSGRGPCVGGQCMCLEFGFGGPDCSVPAGGSCPRNCNGNGICFWGDCECIGGWGGQLCDIEPEKPCPNACGMKGKCVGGQCICLNGFTGDDCSDILVVCPNHCSGHGACIAADVQAHMPARCECAAGWTGADCANFPVGIPIPAPETVPTRAQKFYKDFPADKRIVSTEQTGI